jgi:hypothetical protein
MKSSDTNIAFIPNAVGPFGEPGSLFRRFIERSNTLQLPSFSQYRLNAACAAERAITHSTPYDIFGKVDGIWKETHGSRLFEGS